MAGVASPIQRRARLKRALKTATDDELIQYNEIMPILGLSKGRLVNIVNGLPNFPEAKTKAGNALLFPRRAALQALLDHEMAGDAQVQQKAGRMRALLGNDDDSAPVDDAPSFAELLKASQLRSEMDARLKEQRALVAYSDSTTTAGKVFELLSRSLTNLGTAADPNGLLSGETRAAIDKAGELTLLRIHALMKDMLSGDGLHPAEQSSGNGTRAPRARTPRTSGKRSRGVAQQG